MCDDEEDDSPCITPGPKCPTCNRYFYSCQCPPCSKCDGNFINCYCDDLSEE